MDAYHQTSLIKKPLAAVALFIVFAGYLLFRDQKPMADFDHVKGHITYMGYTHGNYLSNPKLHYIKLDTYDKTFEAFVGKDPGDFSPKFEILDSLKNGDEVIVYYDKTPFQSKYDPDLEKNVEFVAKNGKIYFEHGSKDKYFAWFALGAGLVIAFLLYMKNRSDRKKLQQATP